MNKEHEMVREVEARPLPDPWHTEKEPGWFRASGIGSGGGIRARVRAFEPLERNPDYLLDRVGARTDGPLGRPHLVTLPRELADGVAVLAFELEPDDSLVARIDFVRRAWDLDILVSARTHEVEVVEELTAAMVQLLAVVGPTEEKQ
jgi:hypothetical protein